MKLLIVDDSELLQSRFAKAFSKIDRNIDVVHAFSCSVALEVFPIYKPDTVILDISLPDGSGINLLRVFKKEKPLVKVIMCTNYPTDEFRSSCMELGADYFLDKSNLKRVIDTVAWKA